MTTAKQYWEREGCRLLTDDNKVPSVEDRVIAAFRAGFAEGVEHSLSFEISNPPAATQPTNTNL